GTWTGNGTTNLRLFYSSPSLSAWMIDNSTMVRKTGADLANTPSTSNTENLAVHKDVAGTFTDNTAAGNSSSYPGKTAFALFSTGAQGANDGTWFAAAANFTSLNFAVSVAGIAV